MGARIAYLLLASACLLSRASVGFALYDASSPVKTLTASSLRSALEKRGVLLVEFFAPWCGHCKNLKPEWEKAASALQGLMTVAAVDVDSEKEVGAEFGIKGFPTIKVLMYQGSGQKPKSAEYRGPRTAAGIVEWALEQAGKVAQRRLGGKSGSSGKKKTAGDSKSSGFYDGTDVLQLDDSNFHSHAEEGPLFVEFYAPWCGHCKALKPSWVELASSLKGKVRVAAVDCTASQQTCSEFGVQGFPTIKWFGAPGQNPEPYEGPRDTDALSSFALERWVKGAPPAEVKQLVDEHVWEQECTGHETEISHTEYSDSSGESITAKQLCIIAFLPHILDSGVDGRNSEIKILQSLAEKYKERPFGFLWAEGGSQPELEANLGVGGYGYPALVSLSPSKGKYSSLRGSYVESQVLEFIHSVRTGMERVEDVHGSLATPQTISPWTGEAGKLEVEEEFSLEELMNTEL